jgi:hypothetical protein
MVLCLIKHSENFTSQAILAETEDCTFCTTKCMFIGQAQKGWRTHTGQYRTLSARFVAFTLYVGPHIKLPVLRPGYGCIASQYHRTQWLKLYMRINTQIKTLKPTHVIKINARHDYSIFIQKFYRSYLSIVLTSVATLHTDKSTKWMT